MSLFCATVQERDLDPTYLGFRDGDKEVRQYLEDIWTSYKPYADDNFHDQFQRKGQCRARLWEMRLTTILVAIGLKVVPKKERTQGGPDIQIEHSPTIWIEAIVPAESDMLRSIAEQNKTMLMPAPETEIVMRYTNAVQSKWNKYQDYLRKGMIKPEAIYVIAISDLNFRYPTWLFEDIEPPIIAKALFGIGEPYVSFVVGVENSYSYGIESMPARKKHNGAPVETDLFLNPKYCGISAVLSSKNVLRTRNPGDDFHIFHNPNAGVKMPHGFIPCGQEWQFDGTLSRINDFRKMNKE